MLTLNSVDLVFKNTPDSFAVSIGRERVLTGVFKRLIKSQLKLFKTDWLRVLGAHANVRQFKLRRTQFIAISYSAQYACTRATHRPTRMKHY